MRGTLHRIPLCAGLLILWLTVHATPGSAQRLDDSVDLQQFRPSAGVGDILGVESGRVVDRFEIHGGLFLNLLDDALVLRDQRGDEAAKLVDSQTSADLLLVVGLGQRTQIGVALPVLLAQTTGAVPGMATLDGGGGLGDLRLTPKFHVLTRERLSLAASMSLILPTGTGGAFRSQDSVGVHAMVAADYELPRARVAINTGLRLREGRQVVDIDNGNEITYGVGVHVPIGATDLAALATLTGALGLRDLGAVESPLELLLGGRYAGLEHFELVVGAGPGLSRGYGSPDLRVLAGVIYRPGRSLTGVTPIQAPEPVIRFVDGDDCADPRDGICPEDVGATAVASTRASGPADADRDGVLDAADRCPDRPEDVDGFEDDDGCPDPDNDGDGIPDARDACPLAAEVVNGLDDSDGCPDQARARTIEVTGKVQFDGGKATIRPESFPALDGVVKTLKDDPHITQIRIEGHTDDRGSPTANDALSQRRAQAVAVYLISKGISARRLAARGYGQAQPLVPNDSAEHREQNRRVEFVILEVDGVAVEPPPANATP